MSEEEKEFKADHFENIEELVKTCKMWVTDDDYDAYCRFFDMGAMEEILNLIFNLQKELDKKDKVINNLYEDIEYEYSGTNYLKSLEEYYKEVEDKDE